MQQLSLNSGAHFELPPTVANCPALSVCPAHLLPEVVVSADDPLLFVCSMQIRECMRQKYSFEEMHAVLCAITAVAEQRMQYGQRGEMGLGGPRTYQDVGTVMGAMDWMHEHELQRVHQIKLSLPSAGEEILAARERIQQRIASRRRGLAR